MSFRFFRRVKLAPGLSLNLSKSGGSLSFGPRGAKLTAGTSGVRRSIGVPGTGLYYTEKLGSRGKRPAHGGHASRTGQDVAPPTPVVRAADRLDPGFFRRLFTPQEEEDLVDGLREMTLGHEHKAYQTLRKATHLADGAFAAGMMALRFEHFQEAKQDFHQARRHHAALGKYCKKYGVTLSISLPITERISAQTGPCVRGILLALAEAHQGLDQWREATEVLHELHGKSPDDPVVLLSLSEVLVEEAGDKGACEKVVKLTKDVHNKSEMEAAVLLWKGKALRKLGFYTAARDALTEAFRRKKDREKPLLLAIQYERALVYEQLGRKSRSRKEMEKIYAQAPDYEDVAHRLGMDAGS